MNENQSNKVALVTGAARRIGAEITRLLHANGMRIILHYNSSSTEAQALANELNKQRADSVRIMSHDLMQTNTMDIFINEAIQHWGRLDVLVNNASTFYPTPLAEINTQQWDDLLGVNLKAPLFLSQACAKYLTETKGCVINIVDIHADRPLKDYPVYCVAKAGLAMLTKSLARELAPAVRVNGVSPGAIMWPEVEEYEPLHQEIIQRTALKREGEPRNIADTVWFLIHVADYVTGQIIAVDGGRTLSN